MKNKGAPKNEGKPADPTAAMRQQRRRQRHKRVEVMLTEERSHKLDSLMAAGYGRDRQEVLSKSLDEAFSRLAEKT